MHKPNGYATPLLLRMPPGVIDSDKIWGLCPVETITRSSIEADAWIDDFDPATRFRE